MSTYASTPCSSDNSTPHKESPNRGIEQRGEGVRGSGEKAKSGGDRASKRIESEKSVEKPKSHRVADKKAEEKEKSKEKKIEKKEEPIAKKDLCPHGNILRRDPNSYKWWLIEENCEICKSKVRAAQAARANEPPFVPSTDIMKDYEYRFPLDLVLLACAVVKIQPKVLNNLPDVVSDKPELKDGKEKAPGKGKAPKSAKKASKGGDNKRG